ncbi:alpha/beta hydrolase fold domain-containing protein [Micromonospora sp. M12]
MDPRRAGHPPPDDPESGSSKFGAYRTELDDLRQAREPFAGRIPDWQQTVEASVMDTADDIAYAIHDVEDFYRVGVLQQGSVSAELMAWQRESGHFRAITDPALATAARRPGAAIERLRRQLHRKDAWIADDDAFAAAVEHVREELVDGLLAMPFDGSIEAEQYVARFSARWSTRFVEAITVTDQPSVRSGYVLLGCAQWHEVQVLSSSTTGSCWPGRISPCTSAVRPGCWAPWWRRSGSGCSTRRRSPGCPAGCTTWSSWPRRSCTRVPRTGSVGPGAGDRGLRRAAHRRSGGGDAGRAVRPIRCPLDRRVRALTQSRRRWARSTPIPFAYARGRYPHDCDKRDVRPLGRGDMGEDDQWGDVTAEPRGLDYAEVSADGVPAMWLVPHGVDPGRVIVALHGGGFVSGSLYSHRKMYGHLAKAAGVRVLLATYRQAPEFRFPAQIEDAVTAYRWAAARTRRWRWPATPPAVAWPCRSPSASPAWPRCCCCRPGSTPTRRRPRPRTRRAPPPTSSSPGRWCRVSLRSTCRRESGLAPEVNAFSADLSALPPMYVQCGGEESGRATASASQS